MKERQVEGAAGWIAIVLVMQPYKGSFGMTDRIVQQSRT